MDGPYSEKVVECALPMFAVDDASSNRLNYYCYDPLSSEFDCVTMYVADEQSNRRRGRQLIADHANELDQNRA